MGTKPSRFDLCKGGEEKLASLLILEADWENVCTNSAPLKPPFDMKIHTNVPYNVGIPA